MCALLATTATRQEEEEEKEEEALISGAKSAQQGSSPRMSRTLPSCRSTLAARTVPQEGAPTAATDWSTTRVASRAPSVQVRPLPKTRALPSAKRAKRWATRWCATPRAPTAELAQRAPAAAGWWTKTCRRSFQTTARSGERCCEACASARRRTGASGALRVTTAPTPTTTTKGVKPVQ